MKTTKTTLLLAILALFLFKANATAGLFTRYGINHTSDHSIAYYQQYVDKTAIFWQPVNDDEKQFKLGKIKIGIPYVIKSIEGRNVQESYTGEKNILLTFTFLEKDNAKAKPITITTYDDIFIKNLKIQTVAYDFPFYIEEFIDSDRNKYVGKEIDIDGETYTVNDIVFEKEFVSTEYEMIPMFVYKNNVTGDIKKEKVSVALNGQYVTLLSKVEKPADETIRYGETAVVEEDGVTKFSYVDNVIDIIIFGSSKQFSFSLKNLSENSLKLIWNEAVFVNINGSTSKVMHSGIKYSEKDGDQPASVIIKGAKLTDIACPTENVSYSSILKDWITGSMYPTEPGEIGNEVRLMLPIQIKEVVNEYIFVFDIKYIWNRPGLH